MSKDKKFNKNKKENFILPRRYNNPTRESILKSLARDLLYEIPKYDTRFSLIRVTLEAIVEENPKLDKEQVRQSLYYVKNKGYIKERIIRSNERGRVIKFELTKKGKELLRGYEFKDLQIDLPNSVNRWDGKWRFVIFDVPEKHRYARDIFRDKLKNLGFFMVQQSVWIYPYECRKEIDFILEFLWLRAYVLFFEVKIDNDITLRKYFKERGFKF